jgi:hypothetical protein
MADHDRTLDEEGVPDLEAPLPEKEATGDPQEGLSPPNERPRASVDHGVTAEEQRRPEPLDDRLAREEPDVAGAPAAQADESTQLPDPDGTRDDREAQLVGEGVPAGGAPAPEERSVRTEREP